MVGMRPNVAFRTTGRETHVREPGEIRQEILGRAGIRNTTSMISQGA